MNPKYAVLLVMVASVSAPVGTTVILYKTAPGAPGTVMVLITASITGIVMTFGCLFIQWIAKRWDEKWRNG